MAGIAPEDDDGHAASQSAPQQQQRKAAPEPPQEAIQNPIAWLEAAKDMDDLKNRWDLVPNFMRADSEIVAAKNAAKERLPMPQPDLDDTIPYEGK
jgi:hypothetical protein